MIWLTIQSIVCETVWQLDYTDGDGCSVPRIRNSLPPHYLDHGWCTLERGLCQLSAISEVCSLMCKCGDEEGGRGLPGGEGGKYLFIIALVNYIFLGYQSTCWYLCGFWVGWCSNIGKKLVGQSRTKLCAGCILIVFESR